MFVCKASWNMPGECDTSGMFALLLLISKMKTKMQEF
jgi:hypothetical protein